MRDLSLDTAQLKSTEATTIISPNFGENSIIGVMSTVTNSLEADSNVIGFPALPKATFWRLVSLKRKLPDLFKRFKNL